MNDWGAYDAAAQQLAGSTRPIMRAIGQGAQSVSNPFASGPSELAQVDLGRAELAFAVDTSPGLLAELFVGLFRWVEGRLAANRGDFRAGLEGCMDYLDKCRSLDYYPTTTPRAAKLAATCQILLGDPASAFGTLAWLESLDPAFTTDDIRSLAPAFTTDDIRSLALLVQGRMADAVPVIRSVATEALNRVPGQVCDSVLLLATLTDAEGDQPRSRDLLLKMGAGLEPGIRVFSKHLAHRLGIGNHHNKLQQQALTYQADTPEGYNGTLMASQALRAELARRGWEHAAKPQ
jgi:hypothetical protein